MEEQEVTNSALARACSVSPQAVHKWLGGGKLTADNLAAAAKRLKLRQDWLRSGKLPKKASETESLEANSQRVIELLVGLQGPLAALSAAISEISRIQTGQQPKQASE